MDSGVDLPLTAGEVAALLQWRPEQVAAAGRQLGAVRIGTEWRFPERQVRGEGE